MNYRELAEEFHDRTDVFLLMQRLDYARATHQESRIVELEQALESRWKEFKESKK